MLLPLVSNQLYSRVIGQVYGDGSLVHVYCRVSRLTKMVSKL
jgi:hypothetical protein